MIFLIVLSWIAMVVHLSGYLYQSGKLIIHKKTKGLSLLTFTLNFIGSYIWFWNGILAKVVPAALVNTVVLTCLSIIIFFILQKEYKYKLKAFITLIALLVITWVTTAILITNSYITTFLPPANSANLIIGLVGGVFTTGAFLPQLIKMIRTKNTKNLSYFLVGLYGFSQFLWGVYWLSRPFLDNTIPLENVGKWLPGCIFTILTFALQCVILISKMIFERNKKIVKQ